MKGAVSTELLSILRSVNTIIGRKKQKKKTKAQLVFLFFSFLSFAIGRCNDTSQDQVPVSWAVRSLQAYRKVWRLPCVDRLSLKVRVLYYYSFYFPADGSGSGSADITIFAWEEKLEVKEQDFQGSDVIL